VPATATAAAATVTLTAAVATIEATATITAGDTTTNPVIIVVVPTLEMGGATEATEATDMPALPTASAAGEQSSADAVSQAIVVPTGVPPTGISVAGGMRPMLATFGVMAGLLLVVLRNWRRRS
jgi:hypothetical protein